MTKAEHLTCKWEIVPSLGIVFPDMAPGARHHYIVIARMVNGTPLLIADDLDEATATHIADVHNAILVPPTLPREDEG